jgi:ABC-type nitrate/sulfonate/bicarbonate transport system permease component
MSGQALPVRRVPEAGPGRGWTYTRGGIWSIRILSLVVFLAAWEFFATGLNRALIVPPSEIAVKLYEMTVVDPILWEAIWTTVRAFAIGFGAAIAVGISVGLVMGRFQRLDYVLDPWVFFLYALPSVALIPVLVIWFGIEDLLRYVLVFLASVFPVIINTAAGVKNIDQELIDTARAYCANERQIVRTVVLPASIPFIFAGLRVGMSQGLVGVIGAEYLAVVTGLGGLVINSANTFQTARMFVPIVVIVVIALALSETMKRLQRRFSRWEFSSLVSE